MITEDNQIQNDLNMTQNTEDLLQSSDEEDTNKESNPFKFTKKE